MHAHSVHMCTHVRVFTAGAGLGLMRPVAASCNCRSLIACNCSTELEAASSLWHYAFHSLAAAQICLARSVYRRHVPCTQCLLAFSDEALVLHQTSAHCLLHGNYALEVISGPGRIMIG